MIGPVATATWLAAGIVALAAILPLAALAAPAARTIAARAADALDGFADVCGRWVRWLALVLVLLQFAIVVARYALGVGSVFAQEMLLYMHAALFLLGASYTLRHDGHVRVDVFYRDASPRRKAAIDMAGVYLFLLPMCAVVAWTGAPYVERSWAVFEGSKETSGIPFVYGLKTLILLFAAFVALQGVSMANRAALRLTRVEAA